MLTSIPQSQQRPMFLRSIAEATLMINTKLTLPLRPAEMVSMRDTECERPVSPLKKSKLHLHDEPKPIIRVDSKPPSP